MKNKTMYCLVMVVQLTEFEFSVDCVAVFDNLQYALDIAKEMQDNHEAIGFEQETVYDVLPYELNEEPMLLKFQRARLKQIQETNDKVDEVLSKLMVQGYVDQLIGEDGRFYYELTSEGKSEAKKIPELVKKLFKK